MVKIALNGCYGGFGLSDKGQKRLLNEKGGKTNYSSRKNRTDPGLIKMFEDYKAGKLDFNPNGSYADIYIEFLPQIAYDLGAYRIDEYDGSESLEINYSAISLHEQKESELKKREERSEVYFDTVSSILSILHNDAADSDKKVEALKYMFNADLIHRHLEVRDELEEDSDDDSDDNSGEISDNIDAMFQEIHQSLDTLPYFGKSFKEAEARFEEHK